MAVYILMHFQAALLAFQPTLFVCLSRLVHEGHMQVHGKSMDHSKSMVIVKSIIYYYYRIHSNKCAQIIQCGWALICFNICCKDGPQNG